MGVLQLQAITLNGLHSWPFIQAEAASRLSLIQASEMRSIMSTTARKLIVGVEDLLGVIALGMGLVGAVTTWSPSPEAAGGPPAAFGYIATSAFLAAIVLFFLAARHLHNTGQFSPISHAMPFVCVLLVPLLGLVSAHL